MWILLAGLLCSSLSDATISSSSSAHVRAATPTAQSLLTDAVARSAIVNELIEHLTRSDTFVYLELTASPEIPVARTKLVAASSGARFLRIAINVQTSPWDRLPLLAHELQHALEIADAPDVRDDAGLRRLYSKLGFSGGIDRFETAAARDVERRVRMELARRVTP
jgi:hypothetical protein